VGAFLFNQAHHQKVVRLFDSCPRRYGMLITIKSAFYLLAALCASVIAHSLLSWLFNRPPSITRSLQDFAFSPSSSAAPEATIGSPAHKIRLAFANLGLEVSGKEQFSPYLATCILGLGLSVVAAVLRLPPLFWLGGPAIAYLTLHSLVNSIWDRLCRRLEQEIPSYLMNLASVIQLNANLIQALEDAPIPGGS
jgi:hypothetical protein